jgi:hypothetical protein
MAVRITCVDKPSGNLQDPHEAISQYGWLDEATGETKYSTRAQMVEWMKTGGQAYVRDSYGNQVFCNVRQNTHGTEFLQTVTDNRWTDNLLSLPKCTY